MGGYAYSGGMPLDLELGRRIQALWMTPGDEPATTMPDVLISAVDSSVERPQRGQQAEFRLKQIADGGSVSLIARWPPSAPERLRRDPGDPAGLTIQAYLRKICEAPSLLLAKRRVPVLLVSDPAWFHELGRVVPYAKRRKLRDYARENGGHLSLKTLAWAGAAFSGTQLLQLGGEFPVLKNVYRWRDLFVALHTRPLLRTQLESHRGLLVLDVLGALDRRSAVRSDLDLDDDASEYMHARFVERSGTKQLDFVVTRVDSTVVTGVSWDVSNSSKEDARSN